MVTKLALSLSSGELPCIRVSAISTDSRQINGAFMVLPNYGFDKGYLEAFKDTMCA